MDTRAPHFYEFGPFRIDAVKRLLLRGGAPIPLKPKTFDTLLVLVQNSERALIKEELMQTLWPDTVVAEANLTVNICLLRKALGDDPNEHQYIVTLPGRGYRFVASVRELASDNTPFVKEAGSPAHALGAERRAAEAPERAGAGRPGAGVRSLAVLPFRPLGSETDDEYLGLGVADALITKLSNLRQITVRPTSAVRPYTAPVQDMRIAGRKLGVDSLLEGSIQRSGDHVRVTVQLVRVQDGAPLWAEKFDAPFTSIFAVEDSISEQVTRALMPKLNGQEIMSRRAGTRTQSPRRKRPID